MAQVTAFRAETRALCPVAARVVSYGRSSKVDRRTTLYVLRVARSGREWYVARRFSEFRALFDDLRELLSRPHGAACARQLPGRRRPLGGALKNGCSECRELATHFGGVAFPMRYARRAALGLFRDRAERFRFRELDEFVQFLIETTQGLLDGDEYDDDDDDVDDDDDDDDDQEEDNQAQDRASAREERSSASFACDALTRIRAFLMVDEQAAELPSPAQSLASADGRRTRVLSSSSVSALRVHELDVAYRQSSPGCSAAPRSQDGHGPRQSSPGVLSDRELDAMFCDGYASPTDDTVILHEAGGRGDVDEQVTRGRLESFRRVDAMRVGRRH
ncbi:hypothetical protein P43SY_002919 [Pythium insidiosum]|uniref:PX domain-containing protein n=1 Tax=Pythium insidiosum TaxID=114742 RepID=A0AAD5M456_PYTIN|nr:hypothetical protein P43SY_002919 [Pythium insidiosum]